MLESRIMLDKCIHVYILKSVEKSIQSTCDRFKPLFRVQRAWLSIEIKLYIQWTCHHCCSQWWLFSVLWHVDCCTDIWQMMCHHRRVATCVDTNSITVTRLSPCHAVNMVSCPPRCLCLRRWKKSSITHHVIYYRAVGKYTQVQALMPSIFKQLNLHINWQRQSEM